MASTVRCFGVARRLRRPLAGIVLMAGVAPGCSTGGHSSSPSTSRPAPSTTAPATSTTASGPQTSGSRTVLSPIGLNVRKSPATSAPVLGTAAQGVVLTVLGHTSSGGGWFEVKGATVTGWISAQPALSAQGTFRYYSSSDFSALYPATWSESPLAASTAPTSSVPSGATSTSVAAPAPSSVVFHPASGQGDIVATSAGRVSQLPHGRAGYGVKSVSQVVACGITAGLVIFERSGSPPATTSSATSLPESLAYLAEVRFAVDKQHALGFYADMPGLGPTFQAFKDLVASVSFNAPQCSG